MRTEWKDTVITQVSVAVYVAPGSGKPIHKDRPFHGFVLNDENGIKEYCFSDGRVMRTEEGELFYLPKGSSYSVRELRSGGCYAINFDADIEDLPFCVKLKNREALKKSFKDACHVWQSHHATRRAAAMCALYEVIVQLEKLREQSYMPHERHKLIAPAVEAIERDFTDPSLTVAALAERCGISEVYFRSIFIHSFGVSPKEYLIRRRIEYAKQLLIQGELKISKIAQLCGYGEPCHFSREFKRMTGVSPKEYEE
ncbi:MAG: helix-turn-helix transcriptional regulator [Ruminococcaceae bacterium]|nr:helix-turn-helix transcriptional regulator [Oscillospiraceae bacterium]